VNTGGVLSLYIDQSLHWRRERSSKRSRGSAVRLRGALCAEVIQLRVSSNQNDETLSRNSLRYLSKANLPIAVHQ